MRRALLSLLLLSACTDVVEHGVPARLQVTLTDCDGAEVAAGATHLRLRSFHDGALFDERVVRVKDGLPEVVWLADSGASVARVEAFFGEPPLYKLLAWGQSAQLFTGTAPRELTPLSPVASVRLAAVDRFERGCTPLSSARAGHSATVLGDGTVALVGGFTQPAQPQALDSVELYVPATGALVPAGTLAIGPSGGQVSLPTAHHGAVAVHEAQVLLWGGQRWTQDQPAPTSVVLIWEADSRQVGAVRSPTPPRPARAGHTLLAVDDTVFVLGGLTRSGTALEAEASVEVFDLATNESTPAGTLPGPRRDAAIGAWGERFAVVAGGETASGVSADVEVLGLESPLRTTWTGQLSVARRAAVAVPLWDGVLVAGGLDAAGAPTGATDWVRDVNAPRIEPGPSLQPRHSACAQQLGDSRVLVLGGVGPQGVSAAAEVVDVLGHAFRVSFPGPARWQHACTVLEDGSVLVTGGVGPNGEVLDDVWRYVPFPTTEALPGR